MAPLLPPRLRSPSFPGRTPLVGIKLVIVGLAPTRIAATVKESFMMNEEAESGADCMKRKCVREKMNVDVR